MVSHHAQLHSLFKEGDVTPSHLLALHFPDNDYPHLPAPVHLCPLPSGESGHFSAFVPESLGSSTVASAALVDMSALCIP